ncbi:hypothetical protein HRbin16_01175 [bacterium HR16]|nr:hypothetical protein HRbin16_01175 [bacterium HR16]
MALFACCLLAGARFIDHVHDQFVIAGAYPAGDVEAERGIPTAMFAQKLTVEPHARMPVHRSEMQEEPLALHAGRHAEEAAIPHMRHEVGIADAR